MPSPKSPNVAYTENLAVLSGALTIGEKALRLVLGGEETSTHLGGEEQNTRDIQELLASRIGKHHGA